MMKRQQSNPTLGLNKNILMGHQIQKKIVDIIRNQSQSSGRLSKGSTSQRSKSRGQNDKKSVPEGMKPYNNL